MPRCPPENPQRRAFFGRAASTMRRCRAHRDTAGKVCAKASFTGLPVRVLRRLCRRGEIEALKFSGYWLVRRDEFTRLLEPLSTLQWRTSAARQQMFLDRLQDLAAMLHPGDAESYDQRAAERSAKGCRSLPNRRRLRRYRWLRRESLWRCNSRPASRSRAACR